MKMITSFDLCFLFSAQCFLNYLLLCLIFTSWLACKSGNQNILYCIKTRGWNYFLIAFADVQANYLLAQAYHHTTLASVQVCIFLYLTHCLSVNLGLSFTHLYIIANLLIINNFYIYDSRLLRHFCFQSMSTI